MDLTTILAIALIGIVLVAVIEIVGRRYMARKIDEILEMRLTDPTVTPHKRRG